MGKPQTCHPNSANTRNHLWTWQHEKISPTVKTSCLSVLSSFHHLRNFASPKIPAFSILESRNNSRRRTILFGYTREIQQIILWRHFDRSRHFPQFWLISLSLCVHNFFNMSCGKKLCKTLKYFTFMTNLVYLLTKWLMLLPNPKKTKLLRNLLHWHQLHFIIWIFWKS